jgi:hypothetical protein
VVIGVAEASSSHLAQAADEFIFYNQLMDVELVPEKKAKDPYQTLVEAVFLARKRGIPCTLSTLKVLMIELLGNFDESKYKDAKGKAFSKFKEFAKEAERRDLIQVFSSGSVNEVFLPNEDPYELSQFAPERPAMGDKDMAAEEEEDTEAVNGIGPNDWRVFSDMMRQFDEPVLFIQIYDALRGLRNQEVLDLSNQQIRAMIKQAINTKMLQRSTRGQHAYYKLNPEKSLVTTTSP